jgi:retron-type reverse transcriptase
VAIQIENFLHLSILLNIKKEILGKIVNSNHYFYRSFNIPKRKIGEMRIIDSPQPILKYCQDWVKINILDNIPTSPQAFAYKKDLSIVNNALVHLNKPILFKLDLEDFFHTISFQRVMKVFRICGYSKNVSFFLSKICTYNERLPQGASTSPVLSNIISKRLDRRITTLTKLSEIDYTRYSDDLTFTGNKISRSFQNLVKAIIISEGFKIKTGKEIYIKGINKKKVVTGISISNNEGLKIPRNYKRNLKLELFKYLKYNSGISISSLDFDPLYGERLLGKLNYWKQVEKENTNIDRYINLVIEKINLS